MARRRRTDPETSLARDIEANLRSVNDRIGKLEELVDRWRDHERRLVAVEQKLGPR